MPLVYYVGWSTRSNVRYAKVLRLELIFKSLAQANHCSRRMTRGSGRPTGTLIQIVNLEVTESELHTF